jgi:glycosyltransferase involved in cell wall biosynthesis
LAGVSDIWIKRCGHLQLLGLDAYINAGVLLMNLKQIRQDNLGQVLIDKTIKLWDKIKYQDQDILNIVCVGKILIVDSIYNFTSDNIKVEKHKCKQAKIIHYTGSLKPWHQMKKSKKRKGLRSVWRKYNNMTLKILSRKIKVGLLIDEFFGGAGTAFGGYGFLARKYIAKYIPDDNIQIDVLLERGKRKLFATKFHEDDVDLYELPKKKWASKLWLKKQKYDVYLSIELTRDWVMRHETDSHKKLILWIQDPRPKYEWDEIETVQLFKEENYYNQKIYDLVYDLNNQGRVKFISQGYFLNQKAKDLYKLSDTTPIQYLPNPVDIDEKFDVKTYKKKNNIIFLGRIESVKRGWLFCEIAKRLPEYNFYMLGQTFRQKDKNTAIISQYQDIPNLHFAGHVDGEEKAQYLKDAKILVNTSIHEALPVSFLEALAYGVCLVSNRNPEELTEKFGIWTGQINGDGFDKVDLYVDAVKQLMTDDVRRQLLAEQGRAYVEKIHNVPTFIKDLKQVIYQEISDETMDYISN